MIEDNVSNKQIAYLTSAWGAIFALLNCVKFMMISSGYDQTELELFSTKDAVIASTPIVIWLLVKFDWEKVKIGPFSIVRRIRTRLQNKLAAENFINLKCFDLKSSNEKDIKSLDTNAVNVVIGMSQKEITDCDFAYFIGKNSDKKENIDWRHIKYIFFTDIKGVLIGTMGPARFRYLLVHRRKEFLAAFESISKVEEYLEHGKDIHVKETDSKQYILRKFSKYQIQWFPVVNENGKPTKIIEPAKLAITVLSDIAESL